jgi:MFS transporter, AAHS family, 4-hydroxybenzoate transporter
LSRDRRELGKRDGRSGSVVGSMAGGVLLAMGLPLPTLLAVVAVPTAASSSSILVLGVGHLRRERGAALLAAGAQRQIR